MSNGNTTADASSAAKGPTVTREKAYLCRPKPELKAGLEAYRAAWAASKPGTSVSDQDLISHLCTVALEIVGRALPVVPS